MWATDGGGFPRSGSGPTGRKSALVKAIVGEEVVIDGWGIAWMVVQIVEGSVKVEFVGEGGIVSGLLRICLAKPDSRLV